MLFAAFRQLLDGATKTSEKPDPNKPAGEALKEIERSPQLIRPDSIEAYVEVVKAVFSKLGLPAEPDKTENGIVTWNKKKGSARIIINLDNNLAAKDSEDREISLQITAPLVKLPKEITCDSNLFNLFHLLLDLNNHLSDCRLAVCEQHGVVLVTKRRALGLDQVEFLHMLKTLSSNADKFDNLLARDFNLPMWGSDNEINF